MDLQAAPFDGNLDAIDKTHPDFISNRACSVQPGQIVVVGQGKEFDAVAKGATREFSRGQKSVRRGGMTMKIDFEHKKRGHQRKIQPAMIAQVQNASQKPAHQPQINMAIEPAQARFATKL